MMRGVKRNKEDVAKEKKNHNIIPPIQSSSRLDNKTLHRWVTRWWRKKGLHRQQMTMKGISIQTDNHPWDALVENKLHSCDGGRSGFPDPNSYRSHTGWANSCELGELGQWHGNWDTCILSSSPCNDHCENIDSMWWLQKLGIDGVVLVREECKLGRK